MKKPSDSEPFLCYGRPTSESKCQKQKRHRNHIMKKWVTGLLVHSGLDQGRSVVHIMLLYSPVSKHAFHSVTGIKGTCSAVNSVWIRLHWLHKAVITLIGLKMMESGEGLAEERKIEHDSWGGVLRWCRDLSCDGLEFAFNVTQLFLLINHEWLKNFRICV